MNLKKHILLGCLAIFAIISCGKKEAKQDEDQDEIQIEQQSADSTATNSSNNSQENTAPAPTEAQPAAEAAEAAANKTTETKEINQSSFEDLKKMFNRDAINTPHKIIIK